MSMSDERSDRELRQRRSSRREFLKATAAGVSALAAAPREVQAFDFESFFQKHFRELPQAEIDDLLVRLEQRYASEYGKDVSVRATGPVDGVVFGYGLDIGRCIGCRRCVYACVEENNQSRDPEIHWIRVLEFERDRVSGGFNLEDGNAYYDHEQAPAEDKVYLPISCMQCEDSPCTNVCPTGATWTEPDGIVVIDYDWCIGCRYCAPGRGSESEHAPAGQSTPAGGCGGEVHLLHPTRARWPLSRLPRSLSRWRAQVRQPARSGQRDPSPASHQADLRLEVGARHAAEVLLFP
jgi:molybdopterin-containing oxidoreductase family iron-sulfur binding subunit